MIVRGLSAGYGRSPVIEDVSFSVDPGTLTSVLGPNGSGKSTLARAILGLTPWSRGSVLVAGNRERTPESPTPCPLPIPEDGEGVLRDLDLMNLPPHRRAKFVGFVPQSETATFPFSVRDVVLMGRMAHDPGFLDSREDREIAEAAMSEADCAVLADKRITELSGGEQQRVWLARALAQRADRLILDEPTAHLDAAHVVAFAGIVRKLKRDGKTLVAAFHDLNLALALADRFALIKEGRLVIEGPISDLKNSELLEEVFGATFVERTWLGPDYSLPSTML